MLTETADPAAVLAARYGTAPPELRLRWNSVVETLLSHRSVRAYRADPLPEGTLETAIAAAQSAATSSNLQTWSVVAVQDPARKTRLAALAANQKQIVQAPLFLIWLADLSRLARVAEAQGLEAEGLHYLELLIVAIVDAALAAQNAVVAVESLGLGTVYIGAIRNDVTAVARELALPSHVMPLFGLCLGYPDETAPAAIKPRLALDAVLSREQYAAEGEGDAVAAYDAVFAAFQTSQGLPEERWSARAIGRVRTRAALHGRDKLREALNRLGFRLD
ncbi:NADPH-dependent oxidoreductase [Elioraea sp.]|uniref:NADPH-dependent oxidoreductase n=1 Tax=Elioraea sp. TaxID=2185103 RepID=UPI003F711468